MITITKNGNAIKFAFTDSNHYLYGDGEIDVPVNALTLIVDESNMVTFRKAASNDIFITFDPANSNLNDKAGVIDFYKTNMVGETGGGSGSGVTSGQVQSMIDDSLTDYYDKDEVDAGFGNVNTALAGKQDVSGMTAYTTNYDFAQHSGNTSMHTTVEEKAAWNAKQDALRFYTEDSDGLAQISVGTGQTVGYVEVYDNLVHIGTENTEVNIQSTGVTINNDPVVTASQLNDYYTSAQTQSAISGAVLTKQDTLVSGTNIKTINNQSLLGSGNITISGGGSSNIVELTQAEYDALATKDPNVLYVITDAQAINMNDYWTSAQTSSAITQAVSGYQPITGMSAYTQQSDFAAHSGNTGIHTTTAEKAVWNGKQDALVSGTNIKTINNQSLLGSGNITIGGGGGSYQYYTEDTSNESATIMVQNDDGLGNRSENRVFVDGGDIIIESYNETDDGEGNTGTTDTQVDINSLGLSIITSSDDGIDTTQTELEVQPMGAYINSEPIATEPYVDAAISVKADTSAVTAVNNALTAHTSDTGIHVSAQEKNAWNAKAEPYSAGTGIDITNNVISVTGGGGGATYSAGTNISIDTANTINCTIPAYFNSDEQKGDIAIGTRINNTYSDYYKVVIGRQIDTYGNSNSSYSVGIAPATNNSSFYSQLKGNNSVGIGKYFQITAHQSVAIGSEANSSVAGGVAIGYQANATGTTKMNLNNQIKVDTNNQVYISNSANTSTYCVQEKIETTEAALGGLKFVRCTQAQYDAMVSGGTIDSDTMYIIISGS